MSMRFFNVFFMSAVTTILLKKNIGSVSATIVIVN